LKLRGEVSGVDRARLSPRLS